MGCISSKVSARKAAPRADGYSSLTYGADYSAEESCHVVSLTSSTYGILNNLGSRSAEEEGEDEGAYMGSFLGLYHGSINKQASDYVHTHADFMFSSASSLKYAIQPSSVKHVRRNAEDQRWFLQGENQSNLVDMETINTWELMEGLEDPGGARTPSPHLKSISGRSAVAAGKVVIPEKPLFSQALAQSDPYGGNTDSPVWRKYYIQEDPHAAEDIHGPSFSITTITLCPFEEPNLVRMPSSSSLIDVDAASMSSIEPLDGGNNPGLKLLLSAANSPSCYASPITRRNAGVHSTSLSFDGVDSERTYMGLVSRSPFKSPEMHRKSRRQVSSASIDSLKGSGSPLFDPALMATFEQALQASAAAVQGEDRLQHVLFGETGINSSSSDATCTSSDTIFDADSIPQWRRREKKLSSSKIKPVDEELESAIEPSLLHSFQWRCPPRGECKVVLYFTSLRGIRKTYEDCCCLRLILRGLGIQVDERDVWMHSKFKEELREMFTMDLADHSHREANGHGLAVMSHVPQLFIKGRYIGGAEEVKQLHEDGMLAKLVEGIPARVACTCEACGDVRFVPCISCSGSCKVLVHPSILDGHDRHSHAVSGKSAYSAASERQQCPIMQRCLDCNENGLILCPLCSTS